MKKTNKGSSTAKVKIIISLVVAFVMWLYVISDQDPVNQQRYNNITIQVRNEEVLQEKGLMLAEIQDTTVDITVSGKTSLLYNLPWRSISAFVDLSDIEEKGSYNIPITIQGIPDNVELKTQSPGSLSIVIDQIVAQNREVQIDFTGTLPQGLLLTDHTVNPGSVVLTGGESLLAKVSKVGATLDLTDRKEAFTETVTLKAFDEEGREVQGITLEPSQASVMAAIGNNYLLPIEAVISGTPEGGTVITEVVVTPSQVAVVTQGPTTVEKIRTEPINVQGINETAQISAALILPAGMELASGSGTVQVKIVVEPVEVREFSVSTLEYRNPPQGLQVSDEQAEISVVVRLSGAASAIRALEQNQIQLYVDLKVGKEGVNKVALQMEPLAKLSVVSLAPKDWSVLLEKTP